MAFTEDEVQEHEAMLDEFLERRRPPEPVRDQVDLAYRIEAQSIVIFEKRATPRDPDRAIEIPVAKTTYVRTEDAWRVFWQPSDRKWHGYEPQPEVDSLRGVLDIVDADPHGCFWG
ncbi:MAG: DUF3024 domain-containing protein [Chloroflexota bacterium]|nr:DUF3024 domain-containing protein [Chloroflexota bacterium]